MTEQDLFKAIEHNDINLVKELLRKGVSPNCWSDFGSMQTPLMTAIDQLDDGGSLEMISVLIAAGADVNQWSKEHQWHPLLSAIADEYKEAVRLLFEAGVDPDITNSEGTTPIRIAVEREDRELLELILSAGAPVMIHTSDPFTGRNALGMAVSQQNWEMAKRLLAAGADPHLLDLDYRTAVDHIPKNLPEATRVKWLELLR